LLGASLIQLLEKLLRRHKEGILLKNAADDDHGMCPHDIHHDVTTELGEIVDADDGVVVTAPDVIDPRFELDQIVNAIRMPASPFHLTNDPAAGVRAVGRAACEVLEHPKHAILIEPAIAEIGVGIDAKFELAAAPCFHGVDSGSGQVPDMAIVALGADDMDRLMAAVEAILNEWQQNTVFFFLTIEERTDMTCLIEVGTGK
jgi:hypothetical protein